MTVAGEPKTARNMGDPNSSRINVYKYIKENELPNPRGYPASGDPLSLLEKINNISGKLIMKEKKRVEKRG